ncbi:hypothetical protein [Spirosoma panaciterrae]|uniref:hypothetical protein n=1 Tax=Spirosoma panaciterrae TaxID=496058 RepID=UPI0012F7F210|nr:hypothetical protein [Spirosoma panaciterrae]
MTRLPVLINSPTSSKAVDNLRSLVRFSAYYKALTELTKIPGVPFTGTNAPYYKIALDLFNDQNPELANENKWMRMRRGFDLVFNTFYEEFQNTLNLLVADKESRRAYLKRIVESLHTGEFTQGKYRELVTFFESNFFKDLKGEIDNTLWEELDTIGYAASIGLMYSCAVDNMLKRELKNEGISMRDEVLPEGKEPQNDESSVKTFSQKDQGDKNKNFLDEIATIEHISGLNRNKTLVSGLNPYLYAPLATLSQKLEGKAYDEMRAFCRNEVKKVIDNLGDVAILIKAYDDAVKKQPDKKATLLIEHRDQYVNIINDRYVIIESWYTDFWDDERKTVEKINDLESSINIFCDGYNKPFLVGLRLLKNLYLYRSAIDWFNNLINASNKGKNLANNDNTRVFQSPDEEKPKIFIPVVMKTRLFKTLSESTPGDYHTDLELLLENGQSENRVWVKLRADSLSFIFKQAREATNGKIIDDMRSVANWIAAYFSWGKKNPKAVSEATAYKVLRGNIEVGKDNQIRLKV